MHLHTSKVYQKFTCVYFKVNIGLVVWKSQDTQKMFTKVNRLKMVNQSYLNTGHGVNEVKQENIDA